MKQRISSHPELTLLEHELQRQVEYQQITKVLKLTNGRVHGKKGAALILGLNPNTLYSRMKKLGIPTQSELDDIP